MYATYNFTVYHESVSRIGNCFVWGEADGHRGSRDIATCLHKYIMSVDGRAGTKIKHIIMYCDCCSGQNRNRVVLAMLKYTLTLTSNITEITLKFLLPGHTYMPADSMHATIERFVKRRAVWSPSQWSTFISMAREEPGPYNVTVMQHTDFMDWSSIEKLLPRPLTDADLNKIKWLSVRVVNLKKGQDEAAMRFSFVDAAEVSVLLAVETAHTRISKRRQRGQTAQPKPAYSSRLPISTAKFRDLRRLCDSGVIPVKFRDEYLSLPVHDDTQDCLPETDDEDNIPDNH